MKRCLINAILTEGDAFVRSFGYVMPPFAYQSPGALKASDHAMIRERRLGRDVTGYGQGKFDELGLFLFAVRNGLEAALNFFNK